MSLEIFGLFGLLGASPVSLEIFGLFGLLGASSSSYYKVGGASSSFSMTVQYSAVTVQYSVLCIVGIQCDQLYVMLVLVVTCPGIFLVRVHIFDL